MRKLILSVMILASISSYGNEILKVARNCNVALDMNQKYIELNEGIIAQAFDQKGFATNFKRIKDVDSNLDHEFILMANYERIVNRVIKTDVILKQKSEKTDDFSVVFKKTYYGSSRLVSLEGALKLLPECSF